LSVPICRSKLDAPSQCGGSQLSENLATGVGRERLGEPPREHLRQVLAQAGPVDGLG
jgi:hypothetical protein